MSERDVLLTTGSVGQKPSRHLGLGNAGGLRPTPVRKICVASHGVGWPEAWPAPGPFETRRDLENALWLCIFTATTAKVVYNALLPYDAFILIGFKAIGLNH